MTAPPPTDTSSSPGAAVDAPAVDASPELKLPLVRRFPTLAAAFPVAPIGRWPTEVTAHPELAAALGLGGLWLKRDDRSAEPYGGGKPRKLELLFGRAVAEGRRTVITFGGVGSHHALATALYAPRHGLSAVLMLLPQPRTPEVRRVLLASQAAGAELVLAGSMTNALRLANAREAAAPDEVMIIAAGGSEPLGNVGFVNAGFELAAQIARGDMPRPDVVVMALGTMGSAIGLDIGLVAAGMPIDILAVRASNRPISTWRKLERMYAATVALLRAADPTFPDVRVDPARLVVDDEHLGQGYAIPTLAGAAATRLATGHGLELDPTYTAKAFAALSDGAKRSLAGKTVLFWQSHAAQEPESDGIDPATLPAALRGWVVPFRDR
ncbi:MAG: pyridoxal-phosphate dependent enzyme [Polyangiaceae bacterium]